MIKGSYPGDSNLSAVKKEVDVKSRELELHTRIGFLDSNRTKAAQVCLFKLKLRVEAEIPRIFSLHLRDTLADRDGGYREQVVESERKDEGFEFSFVLCFNFKTPKPYCGLCIRGFEIVFKKI